MRCRIIIQSACYFGNNYLTLLISSSRCLGQQPAGQHGPDRRPGGSVREGSLQSQGQVRQAFLRDGLQQGILQQRQLRPRTCWSWSDPGNIWHRHGTGRYLGAFCGQHQHRSIVIGVVGIIQSNPQLFQLSHLSKASFPLHTARCTQLAEFLLTTCLMR